MSWVATVPLFVGSQISVATATVNTLSVPCGFWPFPKRRLGLRTGARFSRDRSSAVAAVAPSAAVLDASTRSRDVQRTGGKSRLRSVALLRERRAARTNHPVANGTIVAGAESREDDFGPEEQDSFVLVEEPRVRLDIFLSQHYNQSRSYFEVLIDRGAVLVDGVKRKKGFRGLRAGDVIDVRFLADQRTMPLRPAPIPLDVLYEDDDMLVINKPAGLVVHPAPGHWGGTLVNAVLHHLNIGAIEEEGHSGPGLPPAPASPESHLRPGIVHRLDVGTTGVVTVAKTAMAFAALSAAFASRNVKKTYLAVTAGCRRSFRGHRPGGGHLIEWAIGRSGADRRRMAVVSEANGGRPSQSLVRVVAEERDTALVEVSPRTGRTHQIRVHLAEEHCHVLGDATYGASGANRRFAQLATRPVLHARRLCIPHPRTGIMMEFEAPLPEDMAALLRRMEPAADYDKEYVAQLLLSSQA